MIGMELMAAAVRPILLVQVRVLFGFVAVAVGLILRLAFWCRVVATTPLRVAPTILASALCVPNSLSCGKMQQKGR